MPFEGHKAESTPSHNFQITESSRSTPDTPVIILEKDGVSFEAELNLSENTFFIHQPEHGYDVDIRHVEELKQKVNQAVSFELNKRVTERVD